MHPNFRPQEGGNKRMQKKFEAAEEKSWKIEKQGKRSSA